jgi:glycosyltransferase involved in cell wall biosynthesis
VVKGAGFTFQNGDECDLERMLDLLVNNPQLRRQSGARGRERIMGEYQWPLIARRIEKAYYDVLGWKLPHEQLPRYATPTAEGQQNQFT